MKSHVFNFLSFFLVVFTLNMTTSAQSQVVDDVEPIDTGYFSPCYEPELTPFIAFTGVGIPYCSYQFLANSLPFEFWMNDVRILGYEWDFGDGTSGTGQTLYHTFPGAGSYEVCLTIWTANATECCKTTFCDTLVVPENYCSPCDIMNDFDLSISGTNPFDFEITGLPGLLEGLYGFYWDFGDGTKGGGQGEVTYEYEEDGHYALRVTIFYFDETTGTCCSREILRRVIVEDGLIQEVINPEGGASNTGQKPHATLDIYPNPNNGNFVVSLDQEEPLETIEVYDQLGNLVLQKTLTDNYYSEVLDLSHLEKGIYFIIANSGTSPLTNRVIIQ